MIPLTIARAAMRRVLRDRTSLFFMLVLPVMVILLVGATVQGGDHFRVGVVDRDGGPLARDLVAGLESSPSLDVDRFDDLDSLRLAVRRSELAAGIVVPAGLDDELRAGGSARVGILAQPSSSSALGARQAVGAVVAEHAAVVTAAGFAATEVGGGVEDHLEGAATAAAGAEPLTVATSVSGESRFLPTGFTYSAATMLVLTVFVNALAGGAVIIENRRNHLYERMLAAPVSPRAIVGGEALTYLLVGVVQSILIIGVGALLFEVRWGDPVAAGALALTWAAVGAAAGMLTGTLLSTAEQATAIGPTVGIALGMLGGCMWPLEIVPPVMQTIGHLVPHGWAVDSWIELLSRGGGVGDIAGALAVLVGFTVAVGGLAAHRLRGQLAS
jgi:ABC-2 type transport system permease protein